MSTEEILAVIDEQIAQLRQARELIAGPAAVEAAKPRRGRPKGPKKKAVSAPVKVAKRVMSAEGRARIVAAQNARWAAQKKAAKPAKSATKKSTPATAKKSAAEPESTRKTTAPEA